MPTEEAKLNQATLDVEASIKAGLIRSGMTQKELAQKFGVWPAQISRAIKGGNDPKSIDLRLKIYRQLGITSQGGD